jgi:hypothetical protein
MGYLHRWPIIRADATLKKKNYKMKSTGLAFSPDFLNSVLREFCDFLYGEPWSRKCEMHGAHDDESGDHT